MNKLLDLYTDYLQVTFGQASATGLSNLLDSAVSHDKFTRLLSTNEFSSIDLWLSVKALVREHQVDDACLIFDDVIVHKPHTDESELVTWHFLKARLAKEEAGGEKQAQNKQEANESGKRDSGENSESKDLAVQLLSQFGIAGETAGKVSRVKLKKITMELKMRDD